MLSNGFSVIGNRQHGLPPEKREISEVSLTVSAMKSKHWMRLKAD